MSNENGNYEPWPVDFALLAHMPEKGLLGGVHWKGRYVRDLVDEINEALPEGVPPVEGPSAQSRLRSLAKAGYVTHHPGTQGTRIWARTPKGTELLGQREAFLS